MAVVGTNRTPERDNPFLSGLVLERRPVTARVLSGAGGTTTMTPAQLLEGTLVVDCQDAHTWALPTAAQLNAAIPGVQVGQSIPFEIINYGDSTLTVGLGTGITTPTIAGVAAVRTVVTLASKRFRLVCTGVAQEFTPGTVDSWVLYAFGSTAAAVA
jgi:hypothetical protein